MATTTGEPFNQDEIAAIIALLARQREVEAVYPQTHRLFWPIMANAARRLAPPTRTGAELMAYIFLTR